MAAVDQDLLGGGLDIEGWSYIKKEVAAKIADMTDRTTVLRNTFPMLMRSKLESDQQKQIIHELVTTTLEAKSVIDVSFIGKNYWILFIERLKFQQSNSIILYKLDSEAIDLSFS